MAVVLQLEYELRTKEGTLIESSAEHGPLEFVPGRRRLLPAIERLIAKLQVGEEIVGELPATRAFGDEGVLPTMELGRPEFGDEPQVGRQYEAKTSEGAPVRFRVLGVGERTVRVQLLHPLADHDLRYRLKLLAATDPSLPPPLPAQALGIDSAAILLVPEERAQA